MTLWAIRTLGGDDDEFEVFRHDTDDPAVAAEAFVSCWGRASAVELECAKVGDLVTVRVTPERTYKTEVIK